MCIHIFRFVEKYTESVRSTWTYFGPAIGMVADPENIIASAVHTDVTK
jgi:hypothetical protein